MKQEIKQRIVGAIIFVIFISTMVPPILDGRNSENKSNEVLVSSNQFNEKERKVIEIDLRERSLPTNMASNKKNTYIDRFKEYISTISGVKAIGDHTVIITTSKPNPILLNQLSNIFIMIKIFES